MQRVHMALSMEASYNMARISEQQLPVLEQMRRLADKSTPGRPMIESLSKEDLHRWGQLDQQVRAGMLQKLIESKRRRDLDVILQQAKMSDAEFRWGDTPKEGTPEYVPYAVLVLLREMWKDSNNEFQPPQSSVCSMDFAISRMTDDPVEAAEKLNPQLEQLKAWSTQMLSKYRVKTLDESRLTREEAATLRKYQVEVLLPLKRAMNRFHDIANLRVMAKAADVVYDSDRRDTAIAAGDMNLIGTSLQRRIDAGEFDERDRLAFGLWRKINEKIPAKIIGEYEEIERASKADNSGTPKN